MRTLLSLTVLTLLAGCAARFERQMNEALHHQFVGQGIHLAIDKLGYPTTEQRIAGDHIYRWAFNGGATAVTAAVAGVAVTEVAPDGCAIDLVVNDANNVVQARWSGSRRACGAIEDRLEE